MKTVVYQSYRTNNVPHWISVCLQSVRDWAGQRGFEYRFFDDAFFDLIPREVFARASAHKCIMADYARLVAARRLLDEGFDRAIWVDADLVVFAPELFQIPITSGYAFCREIWLERTLLGQPQFRLTVNNSTSVFCRDEQIIPFYLDAANAILRGTQPLNALSIGTDFLVRLQRAHPFPLLTNVGIFGPEMAYRYLKDDGEYLKPYLNFQTSPVYAANLCLSHHAERFHFAGTGAEGWLFDESTLLDFVNRLRRDSGASLNRWFDGGYRATPGEFDQPISRITRTRKAARALLTALKDA